MNKKVVLNATKTNKKDLSQKVRWAVILENMTWSDYQRTYSHPEYDKVFTLAGATALYAWHCRHHLAHLQLLKKS